MIDNPKNIFSLMIVVTALLAFSGCNSGPQTVAKHVFGSGKQVEFVVDGSNRDPDVPGWSIFLQHHTDRGKIEREFCGIVPIEFVNSLSVRTIESDDGLKICFAMFKDSKDKTIFIFDSSDKENDVWKSGDAVEGFGKDWRNIISEFERKLLDEKRLETPVN